MLTLLSLIPRSGILRKWIQRSQSPRLCQRPLLKSIFGVIFSASLCSLSFASPNAPIFNTDNLHSGQNNGNKTSLSEIQANAAKPGKTISHNRSQNLSQNISQKRARKGMFSVNQYDQMLQRVVDNHSKKHDNDSNSPDIWSEIRQGFQLRGYDHARVDSELKWYAKSQGFMNRVTTRATPYIHFILDEIKQRDIPTEIALLPIVESAYMPFAYSSSHAAGLWQFIEETGIHYGLKLNWWYDGRRDIYRSTLAALDFLLDLYARFDGDWLLALAAYNSGPGTVDKAIRQNLKQGKSTEFWSLRLPKETRDYVPKLLAISALIADPNAYDIKLKSIPNQPFFTRVHIAKQIDLSLAAKLAEVSVEELYAINPPFNHRTTAPNGPHHLLIPIDSAAIFQQNMAKLKPQDWLQWKKHKTRPQETLKDIATKYRTTISLLKKYNNLKSADISNGDVLVVPTIIHVAKAPKPKKPHKITHIAKQDESLWEISRQYKVKQRDLAKWNQIELDAVLQSGQKIVLFTPVKNRTKKRKQALKTKISPSPKPLEATLSAKKTSIKRVNYEVRQGDSLPGLSSKFNVTINEIRRWNDMAKNQFLTPGQNIRFYLHAPITPNNI